METADQLVPSLFEQRDYLEVITFYVAATQYATPVSEVRYIEQDKRKTTRIEVNAKLGAEVTTYQGKPVPIYDFAELMGCEAEYKSNLQLLEMLKERIKEHTEWFDTLEANVKSGADISVNKNSTQCEFSRWHKDYKADDEILADIFEDMHAPHQRLHDVFTDVLPLVENQEHDKAIELLKNERTKTLLKFASLFSAAIERLENITRPILLYINTDKKMIAVRLNAISDIVTYYRNDFTNQADVDDNEAILNLSFVAGYLENKDNLPPCVLLDWRIFNR